MKFTREEIQRIKEAFEHYTPQPSIIFQHYTPQPSILFEDHFGESYAIINPAQEEGFSICKNSGGRFCLFEAGVPNDHPKEYDTLEEVLTEAVLLYEETFLNP